MDKIGMIVGLIGAIGGVEFFRWWTTRRAQKQQENVKAAGAELHYYNEVAEFYKKENANLRERVKKAEDDRDDYKKRLRTTQDDLLKSERMINRINEQAIEREQRICEMEVAIRYLLDWRCHREACGDREPPNDKLRGLTFDSLMFKKWQQNESK